MTSVSSLLHSICRSTNRTSVRLTDLVARQSTDIWFTYVIWNSTFQKLIGNYLWNFIDDINESIVPSVDVDNWSTDLFGRLNPPHLIERYLVTFWNLIEWKFPLPKIPFSAGVYSVDRGSSNITSGFLFRPVKITFSFVV